MPPKAVSNPRSERALVASVIAGDPEAAKQFLEAVSVPVWAVVTRLEGNGGDAETAFLHVLTCLKANGYARLQAFDGRSRLSTYMVLVAREVLAERLARRFHEAPRDAWGMFMHYFDADIRRRVARRFPRDSGTAVHDDIYQETCVKLIEDDFRRIRAYDGHGSFVGFVLTTIDRILIDLLRRDLPRRRLPAAIARLSALEQEVYAAIVWEGCPPDVGRLAAMLRGRLAREPDAHEIRTAIVQIGAAAPLMPVLSKCTDTVSLDVVMEDGAGPALADPAPNPEDQLLLAEEERNRAVLIAAVKTASRGLPADERLYLQILFEATDPLPPREVAKQMGCPVEDVYRLKQRTRRWIGDVLAELEKKASRNV
jgi:RNA polymerase primary sigma factor